MKEIIVNTQLPVIRMNYEEVKLSIEESLKKYEGIVVTEEGLQDCKSTQKELAGLRRKIDDYRKSVKREMEIPIKEFESKCKELVALVDQVENPIKEGITEFDNKRREEKKDKALEIINEAIENYKLEEKYSRELTVLDKYLNLSASQKSVVEDIEQRAALLKQQQNADKAKAEMLKATIETTLEAINKTIKTPLEYKDFERYIECGWDIARIVREINNQAELVRKAEQPKEEPKKEVPAEVISNIPEVKELKKDESLYFVDVHVEHNFGAIQALSKFLKDNGYKYEVHNKGKVK
ncbi:DUF1351 domain-containing protein [Clostridium sp.]|uniref:DUF1351 domain-containing protein n=1 Tax=Clostridium sp. TaxID=1506 RepID=UPI001EC5FB09|nr:DUF1351 domain-containing protein [Clostridium sp.]MBS5886027.1 DUF1351 domain-containing protein [Clostridium sp.]